uniref:Uncharacterized protein n=1 Tax=Aegilops tauschii subsp. strangulata TaxID=200361 RepID=A0A453CVS6_AEGTS
PPPPFPCLSGSVYTHAAAAPPRLFPGEGGEREGETELSSFEVERRRHLAHIQVK